MSGGRARTILLAMLHIVLPMLFSMDRSKSQLCRREILSKQSFGEHNIGWPPSVCGFLVALIANFLG